MPAELANQSGKNGKIVLGSSDIADVVDWKFDMEAKNPRFAHSGTKGHETSVPGNKTASGSANLVMNTEDPVYDRMKIGDEVTLLLHQDGSRKWTVPARIDKVSEECKIGEAGEITNAFEFSSMGQWTYPDGTLST